MMKIFAGSLLYMGLFAGLMVFGENVLGYDKWSVVFALAYAGVAQAILLRLFRLISILFDTGEMRRNAETLERGEWSRAAKNHGDRLYGPDKTANTALWWWFLVFAVIPLWTLSRRLLTLLQGRSAWWESGGLAVGAALLGATLLLGVCMLTARLVSAAVCTRLRDVAPENVHERFAFELKALGAKEWDSLSTACVSFLVYALMGAIAWCGVAFLALRPFWSFVSALCLAGAVLWEKDECRDRCRERKKQQALLKGVTCQQLDALRTQLEGSKRELIAVTDSGIFFWLLLAIPAIMVCWIQVSPWHLSALAGALAAAVPAIVHTQSHTRLTRRGVTRLETALHEANQAHDWDGCKCRVCDKICEDRHQFDGCKCVKCGVVKHKWAYCKCIRCGATQARQHKWNACACEICGARSDQRHRWVDGKCKVCGWPKAKTVKLSGIEDREGSVQCFRCRDTSKTKCPVCHGRGNVRYDDSYFTANAGQMGERQDRLLTDHGKPAEIWIAEGGYGHVVAKNYTVYRIALIVGYSGTGPSIAHEFLQTAGFDIPMEAVEGMNPPMRLVAG